MGAILQSVVGSTYPRVVPVSARGQWVTVWDDALTAATATQLCNPLQNTSANFHWIYAEGAAKLILRIRHGVGDVFSTATANAYVYAAHPAPGGIATNVVSTDTTLNIASWRAIRVDNVSATATGVAIPCISGSTSSTAHVDGTTWAYSTLSDTTPLDTLGAWYIGVAVSTALVRSSGTVACTVEALLVN